MLCFSETPKFVILPLSSLSQAAHLLSPLLFLCISLCLFFHLLPIPFIASSHGITSFFPLYTHLFALKISIWIIPICPLLFLNLWFNYLSSCETRVKRAVFIFSKTGQITEEYMAMSLEELLAKEGFKERNPKMSGKASFQYQAASMPLYPYRDQHKLKTSSALKKTDRVKSDIPRSGWSSESLTANSSKGKKLKGILIRSETIDEGRSEESIEESGGVANRTKEGKSKGLLTRKDTIDEGRSEESIEKSKRVAIFLRDAQRLTVEQRKNYVDDDKSEVTLDSNDSYKDIYSNKIYSPQANESEMEKKRSMKGKKFDDRKSMKRIESNQSKTLEQTQDIEDDRNQRYAEVEQSYSDPGIDEAAIRAVISILSGYIKRFLRDGDFRTSFHHSCFASLNFSELEEDLITESKILANLEQAIEVVERAAEESVSAKELKKASLQLSVITGLNSNELKDGFTSGIPNSKLSACAHLYLSVVYKLQKKDRVAAKHLLQVFCDSPFQARTILLPELWEDMFLPHLVHLREWYNQEVDSLGNTPNKGRKVKLLDKVYNEIIDSGTYQFAVYYKDWLSEGVEAPSIPFINVPSMPFPGLKQGSGQVVKDKVLSSGSMDVGNSVGPLSLQPAISKKLYDSMFSRSRKPEVDDVEGCKESEIFPNIPTSSGSSSFDEKQALSCSSIAPTQTKQIDERHDASQPEEESIAKDIWTVHQASTPVQGHISETFVQSSPSMVNAEANELTLKRLARSISTQVKTEGAHNLVATTFPLHGAGHDPHPNSFAKSIRTESTGEDSHAIYDNYDEESSSSSIPKDFLCPLTGLVFEDPITLETGHTFELEAITEWLDQGNRTCPVSGKTLQCQSVPFTNFILKRVIDTWKSENCSKIQREEALLVIHQYLTTSSQEERIANAKHLISLGGLRFLVRKFQYGNLEEKSRVTSILSCCIEAASGSRHYIAKNIKKSCLLELIRSEQIKSKENIVLLLVEMMCLNRRKDIDSFLSGLKDEGIMDTLHAISIYLRTSPPEQRPLVAILLLHFDFLVEYQEYSVYREEAVDAIITALDDSLSNDKVRANCCRALLILGGRFSSSGKIMTEDWILQQSGFLDNTGRNSIEQDEAAELAGENSLLDDDEEARIEEWLRRLTVCLLCDGKKSFLLSISKCLGGTNLDLVRVCLTTVAWLSSALVSFSDNEFPLAAFSSLITRLKETLENSNLVEHKILASMSLFNFSKIPECRILLKTFAKEIAGPLRDLADFTWTAKKLYTIIYRQGS